MKGDADLERGLRRWMTGAAPSSPPERLLAGVQRGIRAVDQRPRWLTLVLVPTMRRGRVVGVGRQSVRATAWILAGALVLAALAGGIVVGGRLLFPATVRPASANGLIAFDAGYDIFVAHGDGSGRRALTTDSNADTDPTWSPDGSHLAFWSHQGRSGPLSLVLIAADGSGRREIHGTDAIAFLGSSGGHANLSWDPRTAGRLATIGTVAGRGTPVLVDLASGALTPVDVGGLDVFTISWSPDGSHIALVGDGSNGRSVRIIAPDGSQSMTARSEAKGDADYTSVAWSPDGTRLVYTRAGSSGTHDVFALDVDTGAETLIATGGEYFWPRYSPDGRSIAYAQGVTPTLWVANADGSARRVIASGLASEDITWSPDGTQILAFSPDLTTLDVVPVNGGPIVSIDSLGNVGAPSWQRLP